MLNDEQRPLAACDAPASASNFAARPQHNGDRLDQHAEQIVRAEAKLIAGDAEDARIAGAEHFDPRAAADAELFEPMHVVGPAEDAKDRRRLPGEQILQGNGVGDHDIIQAERTALPLSGEWVR
jgi:hypothetical protein